MTALQGRELVVHVFVAAEGLDAGADREWLVRLYRRCCEEFTLTDAVAPHRARPDDLGSATRSDEVLAACERPGPGVHQVYLRRVGEALVLSLVRAPAPGEPDGWPDLEDDWARVCRPPTSGVLGVVRILQARLADPDATPDPVALGPEVGAASGTPGDWPGRGVLRQAAPLGPFAVWEVVDPAADDDRAERRIVVVAAADRDPELSAWTWSRGTPELTPLARYLLHAAKVRYAVRVRREGAGRDLRGDADRAIAALLRLSDTFDASGRDADLRALRAASVDLRRLQAAGLGLVDTATRLRELRRTVQIAVRNTAAHLGGEAPTGPFADDAALAAWLEQQLDNDATYLEAAQDRARTVGASTDQLVQRGVQDRRERFNLGLTGVIGAVLMALAAMQSLQLQVTLPKPLLGGVVTGLFALALLVPLFLLRLAAPDRGWSAVALCGGVGLLAGTLPWIGLTVVANARHTDVSGGVVAACSLGVGVAAVALTAVVLRRRSAG